MACEGDPTKLGYITFDPGGPSAIKWRTLDKETESNSNPRGEPNKSTKAILGMTK